MAEGPSHGGHHQVGMFDQESNAHPHLDSGCPSDELALYEGLEQLGMRAEHSQSQGSGEARNHTNPAGAAEHRILRNALINVEHESSTSDHRPQLPQQSEERDDFGLPPQRQTPSRASRPNRDVLITELDMYEADPLSQTLWAGEHDGQDHNESSRYTEQDNRVVNIPVGADGSQTELDAYEAMRSPVHETLRGDRAETAMSSHDRHPSNSAGGTLAEAATIQSSAMNQPESEEQSPPQRNNSIVLPRWQPDAEVTYCPICSTQFSWFNRKHHCRKCGRVVCATCSQHRITIPHEFIVQPPQDTSSADRRPSLSQRDTEAASTTCGGTKVRLCNPCVPDPNTLPPPPIRSTDRARQPDRPTYLLSGFGDSQFRITEEALNAFEAMGNEQSAPADRRRRATSYYTPPPVVNRAPFAESRFPQRTSSQHTRNTSYTGPHYAPPPQCPPGAHSQSYGAPPPYMPSNISRPPPQPRQVNYSTGLLNPSIALHPGQQHVQSMLDPSAPPAPAPASAQVRRREIIPEEDTCWVCLSDLRVVAETERRRRIENGTGESWSDEEAQKVREAHVNDCIIEGERIRQGRNRRQQSAPQASAQLSEAAAGQSSPPVRASRRYYELFPFRATEKDCIDDAECSMCLEDFEPGARMARLECFCRFHEACIRTWWERKPGMCPVHGRDMEGL